MVDLFGIQKETEPAALSGDGERLPSKGGGPLPAADAASGSRTRPKLWGALLVMDSILLIVFGGAVAAKLYQHLGLQTDYTEAGKGVIPPKMIEAVLQQARA